MRTVTSSELTGALNVAVSSQTCRLDNALLLYQVISSINPPSFPTSRTKKPARDIRSEDGERRGLWNITM